MNVAKVFESDSYCIETFPVGSFQCNCTFIYHPKTKEAIIVDPGNDADTVLALVQERQLKVSKILHTHAHFDHIGRSKTVADRLGASLHLHQDDFFLYQALDQQASFFGHETDAPGKIDSPLLDEEEFSLSAGQKNGVQTLHTPGHTPGSCCFYLGLADIPILLSGDTLFQNSIGRTDLPGGDHPTILRSIKNRLYRLDGDIQVITGHGPMTTLGIEKKSNPFVRV